MDENAFLGLIVLWPGHMRLGSNWHVCDGTELAISSYQSLFAILGITYGGDGRTNFKLPDLRGRVPFGGRNPGQAGGVEQNMIQESNLPEHTHDKHLTCSIDYADDHLVEGRNVAAGRQSSRFIEGTDPDKEMIPNSIILDHEGGQPESMDNRQPYLALNYIICIEGIFPPMP